MPSVLPPTMGKYMGNVPRLLDISAKCIDVNFPDVRGIVDLVMLPEMDDPHSSFSSSATDGVQEGSSSLLIPPPHTSASLLLLLSLIHI